ncbi:MAG: Calcium-transporting ATPase 10, plasma membrane-type [Pleopsidium flavum]|nr:MAG: Calcium-transporting ATPase 10, plasma membrane-type [Pleopsidium flavum]
MAQPTSHSRDSPTSRSPVRRQRAPTITIDTSAVSPPSDLDEALPLQVMCSYPLASPEQQAIEPNSDPAQQAFHPSASGNRTAQSFDSKESRPVSPHNVSSPTTKWSESQANNFLSVPQARSRGNSVDSDDAVHSPSSYGGDTYIPSPASSTHGDMSHRLDPLHNNDKIMKDEEALKPDPGTEADFDVLDNKFAFSPGQLNKLINPKSLGAFHALGGLGGLEKGLRTDRQSGLSVDETGLEGSISFEAAKRAASEGPSAEVNNASIVRSTTAHSTSKQRQDNAFSDRKRIFQDNHLPEKKAKSIFQLAWMAYNDKVLLLLTAAAVISLALGIYQSVTAKDGEARVQWVEGVAIMAAIIIVVVVGAANDWQKERQFVKLNKKKDDRDVKVIRSGKSREVSIHDILVGDVMHLEPGDMVPVDGIFIEGHNVKCDESSATGESDLLRKYPGDDVYRAIEAHEDVTKMDPFIVSGAKVTEGIGTFLVTSVGVNSSYGKMMMALREDAQTTPLQSKLNVLAEYIAKLGLAAGLLLFVVVLIKFLAGLSHNKGTPSDKGQQFLQIFIVAVTVVVVAVPEGLPLAVTLALAFATTRMLKDNNLVRLLRACETMGNATTICSDKTGTLTQNKMLVVAGTLGTACRFGDKESAEVAAPETSAKGKQVASDDDIDDVSTSEFISTLNQDVQSLLRQSIAINSTAFEGEQDGKQTFIGSKTETALLSFARDYLAMGPVSEERSNANIVQLLPFDSGRKCMASVVKLNDHKFRMYVKGASEILLAKCNRIIRDPANEVSDTHITYDNVDALKSVITNYASRSLRTIGLLYRDFEEWPPKGAPTQADDPHSAVFDKVFQDMVFLAIVGIQDPLREGVTAAVRTCQNAGVYVRMVTGDNILTAKAIAEECGIYTPGGVVMEGPEFRRLGRTQMDQIIPKLQVLARSSPEDKRILVKRLRELGETVAVTGDGTNDAPALKTADVGFSMGIAGTEVAKEASAIILMDDNFASIVKAIMWGRAVNDSVKKFLQFQITVNITAVVLTFVSAVSSGSESSVLTAVQLLWVNLIMDTFAALALATDPPMPSILNRKPEPKSAPLITLTMWKMIIGQAIYQLVVTFILYFGGVSILSYDTQREQNQLQTLVFNTFVWMQIFNQYNSRRLDNNFDIFEGIFRNYFFIGIQFIIVAGQIMIIFVGGRAFAVYRLNRAQWAYSIVLGALSIPIAVIIRLIPDELIRKLIPQRLGRKQNPQLLVSDEEQRFEWNPALEEIREELSFLKKLRGGRLNVLKYRLQHPRETLLPHSRSGSRSRSNSAPQTPSVDHNGNGFGSPVAPSPESRSRRQGRSRSNSAFAPAAAMAGVIAGSIAGWSPMERGHGDEDSLRFTRSRGRSELESQKGVEIHPGTDDRDPIIIEEPHSLAAPPSQVKEATPAFGQSLAPPAVQPPPDSAVSAHPSQ